MILMGWTVFISQRDSAASDPLMTNDIELLIVGGRLKVRRDCIELHIRGPGSAIRQRSAALFQLALAEIIGHVDKVQFMFNAGAFKERSKPLTLYSSIARKVEHD
jgi:hypothetical protein